MPQNKLKHYHTKRDFDKTPEPKGRIAAAGQIFVIHKHNASHLHYDLRLEVNGVLKSWAVPKGIPLGYNEKHLAIETENHPLEYALFEGTIPQGQYGAGTVKIWDAGTYEQIHTSKHTKSTMNSAIKKGALKFQLHGKRCKGTYALARFKQEGNKNQWLLFRVEEQ